MTEIIGYLLIGTDNSVRKQVELELHNARAVAEKANLAKSNFLSSMSHELRTPLGAILGFAQLIESGSPAANQSPRSEASIRFSRGAGTCLELINEILDLTLIESGKLSLSLEPRYRSRSDARMSGYDRAAGAESAESALSFAVGNRLLRQADRTRVKQVLINLLSNAIKYNKVDGTVVVDCNVDPQDRVSHILSRTPVMDCHNRQFDASFFSRSTVADRS
jgi:signal transduction histidine kinase